MGRIGRIGRIGRMGRVTVPGRVCGEVDAWGAGMGRKSADRGRRLVIGSGASRAICLKVRAGGAVRWARFKHLVPAGFAPIQKCLYF